MISSIIALFTISLGTLSEETKLLIVTAIILIETVVFLAVDYWETGRNLEAAIGRLSEISASMTIVARDIDRRSQLFPVVTARFLAQTKLVTTIMIPFAGKSTVEIALGNNGPMSALNAKWQLFFRRA